MSKKFRDLLRDITALRWLPGKSGKEADRWLPAWIHLADTAGVMERLVSEWLPSSVIDAARSDYESFSRVCRFLALTHDIGKMTPLFAARLVLNLRDIRQILEDCGATSLDLARFKTKSSNSPHALAGSAILKRSGCPESVWAVVGAHHGRPQEHHRLVEDQFDPRRPYVKNYFGYAAQDLGYANYSDSPEAKLFDRIWHSWTEMALREAGCDAAPDLPKLTKPAQVLACGLLIMADWIASSTYYFPLIPIDEWGEDVDLEARLEYAMGRAKLPDLWSPCRFSVSNDDFEDEFAFRPNEIQRAMADAAEEAGDGGIFILEAPMGCGKTEAALAAAEILASKNSGGGIFFGLPSQATANGIFRRIESWAEHQPDGTVHAIRLAHGMAELNDDYRELFSGDAITNEDGESGGIVAHPWFKGNKQALLANFVIGTVDQLLMAALKQKHVMLRHLGLAAKVVIIDECHAYDAYMNIYLDMVVRWLGAYHVPVIILSATLPATRRSELVKAYLKCFGDEAERLPDGSWRSSRDYPLLTWTDGAEIRQRAIPFGIERKNAAIDRLSEDEMIERVREAVEAGGCTGAILNTVARAQEMAKKMREAIPDAEVLLFHSHFTMHDRTERERDLLTRIGRDSPPETRRGLIVVGTQVLEQSLDIDLDLLVTDLCPMDLLLQRIGRLHRHTRPDRPEKLRGARCILLCADAPDLDRGGRRVYGDWPLLMARSLLPDVVKLPDDIADLVQDAYDDESAPADADLREARSEHEKKIKDQRGQADVYCLAEPSMLDDDSIIGMLNTDIPNDEHVARAAVRDGILSISVIVMMQDREGDIRFVPWAHGGERVDRDRMPESDIARKIAAQRLNLPYIFNLGRRYGEVVDELERRTAELRVWQASPMLDGELLLLLDDKMETELCGYKLLYDREQGLVYHIDKGCDGDE